MANVKTIPATVMLRRGSSQKRELRGLTKNNDIGSVTIESSTITAKSAKPFHIYQCTTYS